MAFPTTPRRSKRFQPFVSPTKRVEDKAVGIVWAGNSILARSINPDTDLLDEERDDWKKRQDVKSTETVFYNEFTREKVVESIGRRKSKGRRRETGDSSEVAERYRVGDVVLISTIGKLPSIGVIIAMWEIRHADTEEGSGDNMKLRVHWFLRPNQLPTIRARRDHYENEIYYTISSSDVVCPSSIISHCDISGQPPSNKQNNVSRWSIPLSKRKPSYIYVDGDTQDLPSYERYYCHLAVDQQRGLFYDFSWPEHREQVLIAEREFGDATWSVIVEDVKTGASRRRKKPKLKAISEDSSDDSGDEYLEDDAAPSESSLSDEKEEEELVEDSEDDIEDEPTTPSKKRRRLPSSPSKSKQMPTSPTKRSRRKVDTGIPRTPHKPRTRAKLAQPTPHSKAAILRRKKQPLSIRLQGLYDTGSKSTDNLPKDLWLRAMNFLHVGSRPDALPCREEEYLRVLRNVSELLEEGSGGCIYISGVPGTGKTATVHAIVRELKRLAEDNEANPFTYVEINGLKIPEPSAAYTLLWQAVSGHDPDKEGHLKISAKESLKALTKHFSGKSARGPGSHACVVLMDELDQLVTSKQDVVYNFFNWPTLVGSKLIVLAVANTMDLPERVMSGRVRSRLGMVRINFQPYNTAQLEKIVQARLLSTKEGLDAENTPHVIAPDAVKFACMKVSSISGDARRVLDICRRTVELIQPYKRTARVDDVQDVIKAMQNSPTAAYLRDCSFHERLMLASLVKCIKREGVDEIRWGDVQHQHLIYMNVLTSATDPTRKPTVAELTMVLDSLIASRAILAEDGATLSRKTEGERRLILNLELAEVERVLSDVGGQVWKNVLS